MANLSPNETLFDAIAHLEVQNAQDALRHGASVGAHDEKGKSVLEASLAPLGYDDLGLEEDAAISLQHEMETVLIREGARVMITSQPEPPLVAQVIQTAFFVLAAGHSDPAIEMDRLSTWVVGTDAQTCPMAWAPTAVKVWSEEMQKCEEPGEDETDDKPVAYGKQVARFLLSHGAPLTLFSNIPRDQPGYADLQDALIPFERAEKAKTLETQRRQRPRMRG